MQSAHPSDTLIHVLKTCGRHWLTCADNSIEVEKQFRIERGTSIFLNIYNLHI